MQFKINKGLELPITGSPGQQVDGCPTITRVAVLGREHVGMKPTMLVFIDKKNPRVKYVAPGAGRV